MGIDKKEFVTLIIFSAFALFWGLVMLPYFQQSNWFQQLSPLIAYPLYNSYLIAIMIVAGAVVTIALKKRLRVFNWVANAMASFFLFENVADLWGAPFFLEPVNGCVNQMAMGSLSNASVDGFYYTILSSFMGQTCNPFYYQFMYTLLPIITVSLIAIFGYLQWKDIL